MNLNSSTFGKNSGFKPRTIRPIGVSALYGLTGLGNNLLAIDTYRGFLLQIDPKTDNTTVVNPDLTLALRDVTGLAIWDDNLWFTRGNEVYFCPHVVQGNSIINLEPQLFMQLPDAATGIAVYESTLYFACDRIAS
ncbi:MAG TPA: transglutaminase, partial [Planktothrix sp. UBA8407]|nr:transglutaminase [Planktothrix sp. UBA8407]